MTGWQAAYALYLIISHAWACDPQLTALFAPPRVVMGQYEVCTLDVPLSEAQAAATSEGFSLGGVEALEPLDAFGRAGEYDRFAVAKLYGGRRARVVRGWRERGRDFDAVTLISPYPDRALTHLIEGTMRIRWHTIIRESP